MAFYRVYPRLALISFEQLGLGMSSEGIHKVNTRSAAKQNLYIPKARTNYGKFNIRFQGPKIWNGIDVNIRNSSIKQFKSSIKKLYIDRY